MNGILLLLGTNLGERKANLEQAITLLNKESIDVIEKSSIYESEPWGITDQPWFWNMVVEISTILSPKELLHVCLNVEAKMGRIRKQKWGERLIDIDILYFEDQVINESDLNIPHPGIPERVFTLMPLVEKWSQLTHPVLSKNQNELLKNLESNLVCRKTDVVLAHDMD